MKIGIFGGSFNPIHNAHLAIIKESLKRKLVDEVWIIPCKNHAFNKALISANQRVDMIKLAIKNPDNVKIDLIEVNSIGTNYTINTINELKKKYSYDFSLIIGDDIIKELSKWYQYEQLLKEVSWIIFTPTGYQLKPLKGMKIEAIIPLENFTDLHSTLVRNKIKQGLPITQLVPQKVEEYIIKNKLYL